MNQRETATFYLAKVVEKIIPFCNYFASVKQLCNTLDSFKLNIKNLETRVQSIEAEIQILAEQYI